MTVGTVRTQGTELFFADLSVTAGGTSDPELLKVACATGITGLGGAADQIDTSCLDTIGDKEFVGGLGNPGQVSVPINFIPQNVVHGALINLKALGTVLDWVIALSDGSTDPSITSDGVISVPTDRSTIRFTGYIADFNLDIATNEIVRATLTIQRSGNVLFTPKV